MAGLDSFVSGLQQGYGFTQDAKKRRQLEKLYDQAIESGQYDIEQMRADRKTDSGADPILSDYGDDPFQRMMRKGWRGVKQALGFGAPAEAPTPVAAQDAVPTTQSSAQTYGLGEDPPEYPGYSFAGGGRVKDPGEIARELSKSKDEIARSRSAATERTAAPKGEVGPKPSAPRPNPVEGDPSKYSPAQKGQVGNAPKGEGGGLRDKLPKYKGTGMAGHGFLGNLKAGVAGYAAGAGIGSAVQSYGTGTDEFANQLGLPKSSAGKSFLGDLGIRTVGALGTLGRAVTPDSWESALGMSLDESGAAKPPPQAAPAGQAAAAPPQTQAATETTAKKQAAVPAPAGGGMPAASPVPTAPQQEFVDPKQVDLASIPDMGVQDWIAYRQEKRRNAGLSGKTSHVAEADKYVDELQHRGFLHYGQIAMQYLQAGDEEGAAKSMMMAYQYFPNGTNLRFGTHNGKLVAVGIDPQTGQPKGAQAIEPKQLAMQLANFQDPNNFKAWTLDWRAAELQDRAETRMQGQADSQATYQDRLGQAALMNAESNATESAAKADYYRAGGGAGGGGGLKPDTIGSAEDTFVAMIDRASMTNQELQDPATVQALAGVMSKIYQQNGGRISPQQVAQLVLSEYSGMQSSP